MEPPEFMERLAALVPRPRLHLIPFDESQGRPVPPRAGTKREVAQPSGAVQQWIFHQAELTTLPGLRYSSGHRKGRLKFLFGLRFRESARGWPNAFIRNWESTTLEERETAAHDGRLAEIGGFGKKRIAGVKESLSSRLGRSAQPVSKPSRTPPVSELLDDGEGERQCTGRSPGAVWFEGEKPRAPPSMILSELIGPPAVERANRAPDKSGQTG
jgi:hypothetical protein